MIGRVCEQREHVQAKHIALEEGSVEQQPMGALSVVTPPQAVALLVKAYMAVHLGASRGCWASDNATVQRQTMRIRPTI